MSSQMDGMTSNFFKVLYMLQYLRKSFSNIFYNSFYYSNLLCDVTISKTIIFEQ